jgi:hypothetical protein
MKPHGWANRGPAGSTYGSPEAGSRCARADQSSPDKPIWPKDGPEPGRGRPDLLRRLATAIAAVRKRKSDKYQLVEKTEKRTPAGALGGLLQGPRRAVTIPGNDGHVARNRRSRSRNLTDRDQP